MHDLYDDQARLHDGQERLRWQVAYANHYSKEVERHYRARLVRGLEALDVGPVEVMAENAPFDLLVNGHATELKVSRPKSKPGRREYYQALMHDPNHRHHLDGDLVVVLCVDVHNQFWPYVIPRLLIGRRRTVEISSHPRRYAGQWADYLEAWEFFNGNGHESPRRKR